MHKYLSIIIFAIVFVLPTSGQNQLPIENGSFETISDGRFVQWTNQANNGGSANFSIETNNLISGSTKALKSEIISLGAEKYHVKTKSDYGFQVIAGKKYTVSFYAKIEGASSRQIKLVFQSETEGSFIGKDFWVYNTWQRFTHTFIAPVSGNQNKVAFWYLQAGITYFLDEVNVEHVPDNFITIDANTSYQTIEGFGAGIKRRTEDLYALNNTLREEIERLCFQELEVNMIRFFVYHDLEPVNDNSNPFDLDETQLDWTRYDSNASNWRSRYIGEALNNAFSLSTNGFDHIIGNCNSAPGWLKTNGQHNNGGTLIPGGESEYSEFLTAFLKGMKSRYNIDVTAISPTNEPDYEVSYESMNTTTNELSSIIKNLNTRLDNEGLSDVKILSPECYRVYDAGNSNRSATNFINTMFTDPLVESAVDVVATHTYADKNHDTDWGALKTAANNKPVWVTESANLKVIDNSMNDAANYIKWMLRGFNEGGMTAYMMHLFYEETDDNGYSSLVAWTPEGEIILAKRYYIMKHFANLIKKGYRLINVETQSENIWVAAFKSPDDSKIVLQVFNEGEAINMSLKAIQGTTGIDHFMTSDATANGFNQINDMSFNSNEQYAEISLPALSFHSFVYTIDETLASKKSEVILKNNKRSKLFPNPTRNYLTIQFPELSSYKVSVFQINGVKVIEAKSNQKLEHSFNVNALSKGVYFVKIQPDNSKEFSTIKFIKQ